MSGEAAAAVATEAQNTHFEYNKRTYYTHY